MMPSTFFKLARAAAWEARKKYDFNIPVAIAQAALESAWGESQLAKKYNNLKGVKVGNGWTGLSVNLPTQEEENGKLVWRDAYFKVYRDWVHAFEDYGLLMTLPRYKYARDHYHDPVLFLGGLVAGGYATDSAYSTKVLALIKQYNLDAPEKTVEGKYLVILEKYRNILQSFIKRKKQK